MKLVKDHSTNVIGLTLSWITQHLVSLSHHLHNNSQFQKSHPNKVTKEKKSSELWYAFLLIRFYEYECIIICKANTKHFLSMRSINNEMKLQCSWRKCTQVTYMKNLKLCLKNIIQNAETYMKNLQGYQCFQFFGCFQSLLLHVDLIE